MTKIDHKKVVKILTGDRVSLPKTWMEKWKIKKGDLIVFEEITDTKQLKIIPVVAVPRDDKTIL